MKEKDRVSTPRGAGTVSMVLKSVDMRECDAGWHHAVEANAPVLYRVRLDAGCEGTFGEADLTVLAATVPTDRCEC